MTKKIMNVDDSVSMRQIVSSTLQSAGYETVSAVDGEDALGKLATTAVDLIITDLNMPRLDGIGLIKRLRASTTHKFVPVLILTTVSEEKMKQEGRAAGATGWVVKPFRPEQLLATVRKVLGPDA
ncbi:MAG: response regulator [Alphaproteobacteria bacterium]|nr:response regulator [Alphaproteobacteria bacterium]